jgi:hypothetical protein
MSYSDWRTDTGDTLYVTSDHAPARSIPTSAASLCLASPNPTNIHNCSVTTQLSVGTVIRPYWGIGNFGSEHSDSASRFTNRKN